VRKTARLGGRKSRSRNVEISLIFISKSEMRTLNKNHRSKNKPTDVLSFPVFEAKKSASLGKIAPMADPDGVVRLGEIFIAPEVVKNEAHLYNHGVKEHFLFL